MQFIGCLPSELVSRTVRDPFKVFLWDTGMPRNFCYGHPGSQKTFGYTKNDGTTMSTLFFPSFFSTTAKVGLRDIFLFVIRNHSS